MTKTIDFRCAEWVRKAIADKTTRVFGITAGLGAGKSHGGAQWHLARCIDNQESDFSAVFQPVYRLLKAATIPKFKAAFQELNWKPKEDFQIFSGSEPRILLPKLNHEIHLLSADNPNMIVAAEYSHASLDEAGEAKAEAMQNIRSRVRDRNASYNQTMVMGAPQGMNAFAEWFDNAAPGWIERAEKDYILKRRFFRRLRLSTRDNPYLPDSYVENLIDTYGHNPNLLRSYIEGFFCPFQEGVAVPNYSPTIHNLNENIEADPYQDLILTFDFNAMPMTYVVLQKKRFYEGGTITRYIAIDEISDGITSTEHAVTNFAAKFPVSVFSHTKILIYGDRSGHASSHKIDGSDYDIIRKKLKELGYQHVVIVAAREVAPEAESIDAVQRLFTYNLLLIGLKCKNLKRSLLTTCWQKNKRKLEKPSGEDWTHPLDAVKYFCWQETRKFTGKDLKRIMGVNY